MKQVRISDNFRSERLTSIRCKIKKQRMTFIYKVVMSIVHLRQTVSGHQLPLLASVNLHRKSAFGLMSAAAQSFTKSVASALCLCTTDSR